METLNINGKKLILNQKNNKNNEQEIIEGDLIIVIGEYESPDVARNYGGFNYREYLKSKKIYGTVFTSTKIEILKHNADNIFQKIIRNVQGTIKGNIRKILPPDMAELCIGILIGDRTNLSEEIELNFKESNLTHMLAVSGAHISYILLGLIFILKKVGKRTYKIITIPLLIFFMALTNFTPSVMRASIMTILELIANLLNRKSDIYQNLSLASIVILLINPYYILDIGFQLSFAGTIGIVFLNQRLSETIYHKIKINNRIVKYIINLMIVTISANIAILPIMAYQFNTISLTFWISNILASNLMGIIIIIGFITLFISFISINLSSILAIFLNFFLTILSQIAGICSKLPFSNILIITPHIMSIIFYYAIIISWHNQYLLKIYQQFKKFIRTKLVYIIIILIFLINFISFETQGKLQIYFIDVGQGDSCLIVTPENKTILIDGGGSETGSYDVGEKILIPYLLDRRIKALDYVIISHFDTDHVGGILTVLEKLKVKNVIISKQMESSENYQKFKEIIVRKKINVLIVNKGNKISIEKNIDLNILWPNNSKVINDNILNNNSIVCKLCYNKFSILFTGDIEEIAEKEILQEYEADSLNATILKVRTSWIENIVKRRIFESN